MASRSVRTLRATGISAVLSGAMLLATQARSATLDASGGLLSYVAATGAINALTVSLSTGNYSIDDPGEASISLTAGALAAGCSNLGANTVQCPESAVLAWSVSLSDQADSANLIAVIEPATITWGSGNDLLIGGSAGDSFIWNPGDASDNLDGGPGSDSLSFNGSNANEHITLSATASGFTISRDVAAVLVEAAAIEAVALQTLGGDDTVTTHPLPATSQSLDGGPQGVTDTLIYDAGGACTTQTASSFQSLGSQLVTFAAFESVGLSNQCSVFPATLDVVGGALSYDAGTGAANALTASLSAGSYTIDDTGEPAITLGAGALAAGCANFDANTVTCPESAIGSWNVLLRDQADLAMLSAVIEPITLNSGSSNDVVVGGAGGDTFTWVPGDGSDSFDGGPGSDALSFVGSNANENISVSATAGGFQIFRDVASVTVQASAIEALALQTLGGEDSVTTHPLPTTSQSLDGGTQTVADTLTYDAGGACTTQTAGSLQSLGAQVVAHAGFETVNLTNQCTVFPSTLDIGGGALVYTAAVGAANSVSVTLSAGTYTIDDAGEPAIVLGSGALAAGCANLDLNTVTCPESAIATWSLLLSDQADVALLGAVIEPITLSGGQGNDTLFGGAVADTFLWRPGDGSDSLDGGPGADTLDFDGSNANENIGISPSGGGFQITRDVAAIALQATSIEALILETFGGNDTVTTRGLPATSQSLDGGTQSSSDVLSYDAAGACTTQGSGSFHSIGSEVVAYAGFEQANLIGQCPTPTPVPALGGTGRALLAVLLGIEAAWLAGRRLRAPAPQL